MLRPLQMAHDFLAEVVTKEDVVVDATMGNGHDTLFLAQLAKQVYAFDIQQQAVEKTRQRLSEAGLDNAQLILAGHESLDQYTDHFKAAIFNLGQVCYYPTRYDAGSLGKGLPGLGKRGPRSYHDLLWA